MQNSQEHTCARVPFLIKLQAESCNIIKKQTMVLVFSFDFCEIFKNTFFYRTTPMVASEQNWKKCYNNYTRTYLEKIWPQVTVWVLKLKSQISKKKVFSDTPSDSFHFVDSFTLILLNFEAVLGNYSRKTDKFRQLWKH